MRISITNLGHHSFCKSAFRYSWGKLRINMSSGLNGSETSPITRSVCRLVGLSLFPRIGRKFYSHAPNWSAVCWSKAHELPSDGVALLLRQSNHSSQVQRQNRLALDNTIVFKFRPFLWLILSLTHWLTDSCTHSLPQSMASHWEYAAAHLEVFHTYCYRPYFTFY